MGGAAQSKETSTALSRATANTSIAENFPTPTNDPVDIDEYYRILDYDPVEGGGDWRSFFNHGFKPDNIVGQAEKAAARLLPNRADGKPFSGWKDDRDAIRHALGSYLLTQEYEADAAKKITDGHERAELFSSVYASRLRDDNSSRLQDLYNNQVGREAALDPANKDRDPEEVIMELYRAGKLQTLPFNLE